MSQHSRNPFSSANSHQPNHLLPPPTFQHDYITDEQLSNGTHPAGRKDRGGRASKHGSMYHANASLLHSSKKRASSRAHSTSSHLHSHQYIASNKKRLWNFDPNSKWAPRHSSHPLLDRHGGTADHDKGSRKKKSKRRNIHTSSSESSGSKRVNHSRGASRHHGSSGNRDSYPAIHQEALHVLEKHRDTLLSQLDNDLHLPPRANSSLVSSSNKQESQNISRQSLRQSAASGNGRHSSVEKQVDHSISLGHSLKERLNLRDRSVFDEFVDLLASYNSATERESLIMEAVKEAEDVLLFQLYNESNSGVTTPPHASNQHYGGVSPITSHSTYYDGGASERISHNRRRSDDHSLSTPLNSGKLSDWGGKPLAVSSSSTAQFKMPDINSRTNTLSLGGQKDLMSGLLMK